MDNTELHYLTYDPEEIWNRMTMNYVDAGGDILYPGDEKEMLLRSVQADIVQVFAGIDNALRMQTLRYAVGDYLDILGELRGCERVEASPATAAVTITAAETGETYTLAAGTSMTSDGELFWLLMDDLTLSGSAQTLEAEVVAAAAGTIGNALTSGTQLSLTAKTSAVSSIVASADAYGGRNREDDDNYRERIRQHGLATVTTGPASRYEEVAILASPYVVDAKAVNGGAGRVNVYIIVEEGEETQTVAAEVRKALTGDVIPLTDYVTVSAATDIPYTLNVEYTVEGNLNISSELAEAVSEYQEWQDNKIGRAYNPEKLKAALYQAGCDRVEFIAGSEFDESSGAEYTAITTSQRCKGTITLTKAT